MRALIAIAALLTCACGPATQAGGVPEYGYEVVHTFRHDPQAFTQGLVYLDGVLYEGTGLEEQSSIRKVKLETGEVLQKRGRRRQYFGEGIVKLEGPAARDHLEDRDRLRVRLVYVCPPQ